MTLPPAGAPHHPLPGLPARLLRLLLPIAERDEVLEELGAEYREHAARRGPAAARRWLWRQVLASVPPLLRRSWWRGMTGFEPKANRSRPGGPAMESWIMDVRYAVRRLRMRPTYALLAVLTLALGVGGAAAITGVVRALLFEPLPYANEQDVGVFWFDGSWSEQEFLYVRPDFPGFQQVAAYRQQGVMLQIGDAPPRLAPGVSGTAELFQVLGRTPFIGRAFQDGDDLPGSEPVAVISYGLWQELGGDPAIVGRRLRLDGTERTVVGVMPRGFWFPDPTVRVWLAEPLNSEDQSGNYTLVGRLAPGVRMDALAPYLARLTARLDERYDYPPQWDKTQNATVTPVREFLVGSMRPALLATLAAMGMILLIACANVASLMLGQVDGRATELAVRSALGAERRRLLQQLLAESVVVGLAAGLAGAALAAGGFQLLVGALPLGAWAEGATLDWSVFWAAIATALGASLLIALVPVISLWRGDLRGVLSTSRTGGIGGRGGRMEGGLVVAEVALAVLMAAGAALLVRSVSNLYAIDPGVDTREVAVVDVLAPASMRRDERRQSWHAVLDALRAVPGVQSAAAASKLPLRGSGDNWGITVEGRPDLEQSTTAFRVVTPDYFETMGITLRRGRLPNAADREGNEPVVVITEALAGKYFAGESPVGQRISTGFDTPERIIGVVEDVAEAALTDAPTPARYMLLDQIPYVPTSFSFVLRVQDGRDAASVLADARRAVEGAAPGVAIQETTTMGLVLAQAVGPARQIMLLLTMLTGLAVVLGAVGVYGIISHFVNRRKRDWAIRIALGLSPSHVVARVVRRGAVLVLAGIAIGVVAAAVLARLIASLLYGVGAADPLALAAAGAVLLLVGLAAAYIPAYRASRTHPALVLREE
ncbi:MAG TPA: ADOP family duplicated permease [Gemmatimonadaceae bacterium]|nr:ADOP family duplicated permease [Gemmatimonadaceae bacterium]